MRRQIIITLLTTIALFALTSCNWDVWQNSVIDYGNGNGNVSATLNFIGDAPKYAWATKASYTDKIVITWNGVTGADYYEIYRSEDSSTWEKLTTNAVATTSYTDTNVEAGKTYQYKVRARSLSSLSLLGEFSNVAYGNTLTAPISFSASQGESSKEIRLKWSKVENVAGYKIYWSPLGYGGTWNVLIPDGMQVEDYTYSSNTTEASFVPEKQYKGSYLYFYIVAISKSNETSDQSVQRIGYTFVEGAPTAPKNFKASRGDSKTEITLSWDAMHPHGDSTLSYDWDIYRSAEGESEILIYSTDGGSTQPDEADGKMTYTDTKNLKEGVEYTYTIIAVGDVTLEDGTVVTANGKPSTAEGFLLSPPTDIISKKIADCGFEFVFKEALGANENASWFYIVYGKKEQEDPWEQLSIIKAGTAEQFTIKNTYSESSEDEKEHYQYFDITTNTGSLSSLSYADLKDKNGFYIPRPSAVDSLTASDNTVFSHSVPENGSYPVCITLTKDSAVSYYEVRIWKTAVASASEEGYSQITVTPSSLNKSTTLLKDVITTPIGEKYYFAVNGKDDLGRESGWSKVDSGYSAITGATLIKYMQIYCFKPWEHIDTKYLTTDYPYKDKDINTKWKNSQIYDKISQAGLDSLSDGITEDSYFHSGTVFYKAVRDGIGGSVSFSYSNFGEVEWMNTTGSYTMNVKLSGDGSVSSKTGLKIKGMYPAEIGMGNLSVVSQSFNGTYTVTQENGLAPESVSPKQN